MVFLVCGSALPGSRRPTRITRLCRYVLRPPLALHRLSRGDVGMLLYRMKRPRHGSLWLSLTPEGLLAKLATLIPPPRVHGVHYHGVFAPNPRVRSRVVPEAHAPEPATRELPDAAAGDRPPDRAAPELDAKAAHKRPSLRTYRVPLGRPPQERTQLIRPTRTFVLMCVTGRYSFRFFPRPTISHSAS